MNERPEKIYPGRFWFYVEKVFSTLCACLLFVFGGIVPLLLGIISLFRLIPSSPPSTWFSILIIVIGFFDCCIAIYWILANPEIATSSNYLWFRHLGIWQKLRWIDVGAIDLGNFDSEEGIYIFSEKLPVYQHFSTFNPGIRAKISRLPSNRRKGRALFISPSLKNYQELVEALPKLRWQATQRRHQEKRRHQH